MTVINDDKYRVVQRLYKKKAEMEYWPEFKKFGTWWAFERWYMSSSGRNIYSTLDDACAFLKTFRDRDAFNAAHKHLHNTVVECPTCGSSAKTKIDLQKL